LVSTVADGHEKKFGTLYEQMFGYGIIFTG